METSETFLFKSISYNVIMQVFFRLLSFVLNAILLRYVSTDLIGVCNFRLALLYTTVMFLSREPFRRALPQLKSVLLEANNWSKFVNSLWLVVPNGFLISIVFAFIWNYLLEHPNEETVSNYTYSIVVCLLAFLIELTAEPANLINQMYLKAKQKVVIEANSLLMFHLTFVFVSIFMPQLGALSYALGRLVYSFVFLALNYYCLLFKQEKRLNDLLPKSFEFDLNYLNLVKCYYTQSMFKQLLTEGERYLITMFNLLTFSQSGIYEIVNNLGSLIARFIFLPIEDACYIYFTNSLERGILYKQQQKQQEISVKSSFENLIKLVSLIGFVVLVFGQSYSQLLLQIYGGDKLGQNETCVYMLRFHCIYVLLLAINGVTESLFNATMSDIQISKHNNRLILFSVIFLLLANLFSRLFGIYGFLLANCFNMSIRIYFSCLHIQTIFTGFKYEIELFQSDSQSYDVYKSCLPTKYVSFALIISFLCAKLSEHLFGNTFKFLHLIIGACLFFLTCFIIFKKETKLKNFIFKFLNKKNI